MFPLYTVAIIVEYHSIEKVKAEQKLLIENNNTLENNKKNLVELFDKIFLFFPVQNTLT